MKRHALGVMMAAAVILAASVVPAGAQFYIGVRGGLSNQDVSGSGDPGDISFDKDSGALYGGQIGFKLSALAIEGVYYRTDHSLLGGGSSIPEGGVDLNTDFLGANVKLGIPLVVVYPYITVGYGMYSANLESIGKDSDSSWNAGAGVQVKLGKIGLFGELRYTDFSIQIDEIDWDFGGLELHFGLNIIF